tara:strand:+ start:86 stop:421 length:336 start_codon:yes stop_codon:yes gene_type:complete
VEYPSELKKGERLNKQRDELIRKQKNLSQEISETSPDLSLKKINKSLLDFKLKLDSQNYQTLETRTKDLLRKQDETKSQLKQYLLSYLGGADDKVEKMAQDYLSPEDPDSA